MSALKHIIIKSSVFLFFLLAILAIPQKTYASSVIFQDNFNHDSNGSFPSNWQFYSGSTCPNTWNVDNGILKIAINYSSCATDILPETSLWNQPINNYILDVDMTFISGTDHNLVYRRDLTTGAFWEIHFQSPGDFGLNLPDGIYKINLIGNYVNGKTYHIKTIVNNNNLQILVDNILVREYQMNEPLPAGTISLRAGVGEDPESETWFDNVVVTSIDNPSPTPTPVKLAVPYLNQANPQWGNKLYDFANKWSPNDPWIKSWGCALTSAVMVFKYYGINKMPDGQDLNPATLNEWLKNNDGYHDGGNVNWVALQRLSKLAKTTNNTSFDALQVNVINNFNPTQLTSDLNNSIPDILDVGNHFVVGTGINENTFDINDPGFSNRHTLSDSYSSTFSSMRRFVPSNTDLSYIVMTSDPKTTIRITDKNGAKVGDSYIEGLADDQNPSLTNKILKIYNYAMPSSGDYNVQVSSTNHNKYSLKIYLYDSNGNVKVFNPKGITINKKDVAFIIHYDKNNLKKSYINKKFVFNDCKNDVTYFCNKNDINNKGVCNSLLSKLSDKNLAPFFNELEAQKNKHISQDAYESLLWDINAPTN